MMMTRLLATALAIAFAARTAAADSCTASLPNAKATKLGVHAKDNVLVANDGARFPAISSDGKIAALFTDEQDFTGSVITTVVVWSRSGVRVGEVAVGGERGPTADAAAVARANKLLAGNWRELKTFSCPAATSSVELGGGLVAKVDKDGTVSVGDRAASFSAPGTTQLGVNRPCGTITGIARAFGTRSDGVVVLVPARTLGGDSCFGSTDAELALVVRVR